MSPVSLNQEALQSNRNSRLAPLVGPSQIVNMSTLTHSSAAKLDALSCAFVDELGAFAYELSSLDFVWNVLFPGPKGTWHRLHVNKYQQTYLVETIRMFLAIHEAKLPISIANPEGVRKRLLAQDNIGIVPCYASLHRANQHSGKEQDVFDVMHYDELGRFKRRITPFISWEPLPILTTG